MLKYKIGEQLRYESSVLLLRRDFIFRSSFRFIAKLSTKYRRPHSLPPHGSTAPALPASRTRAVALVTADEPASTPALQVHSSYLGSFSVFSTLWILTNVSCIHSYSVTQNFHCPKNPQCSISPAPPPLIFLLLRSPASL